MEGHRTYWFNGKFYYNDGKETIEMTSESLPMKEWLDMMVKYMEKFK